MSITQSKRQKRHLPPSAKTSQKIKTPEEEIMIREKARILVDAAQRILRESELLLEVFNRHEVDQEALVEIWKDLRERAIVKRRFGKRPRKKDIEILLGEAIERVRFYASKKMVIIMREERCLKVYGSLPQ